MQLFKIAPSRRRVRQPPGALSRAASCSCSYLAQGIWLPLHGYSFSGHPALGRDRHVAAHGRGSSSPAGLASSRTISVLGRLPLAG